VRFVALFNSEVRSVNLRVARAFSKA
jgi:hypothetical protein